MSRQLPIIGITLGDAAGISPEIVVKALCEPEVFAVCRPLVIGDFRIVANAAEQFSTRPLAVVSISSVDDFRPGVINVLDVPNLPPGSFELGKVSAAAGDAFVQWIRHAARLALDGKIDAIASAPTNKESMNLAGHEYAGQTEVFAEVCGTRDYFTVLTGGPLKVFLLSSHVSLRGAIELVTPERLESVIRIAASAMRELWGKDNPKISVAGLNPHAGDGGLFGQEEIESVTPTIRKLQREGIRVDGPHPADSLYFSAEKGSCDALVGMYHDQGVIPLKKYGYVTVIAGTPIIRTTAGHGTAYDIAGKGVADASVMVRAIKLAAELAVIRAERGAAC